MQTRKTGKWALIINFLICLTLFLFVIFAIVLLTTSLMSTWTELTLDIFFIYPIFYIMLGISSILLSGIMYYSIGTLRNGEILK